MPSELRPIRPNVKSLDETRRALQDLSYNIQIINAEVADLVFDDLTINGTLTIDALSGLLKATAGLVSGLVGGSINDVPLWNGSTWVAGTVMGGGGAPVGAPFVTTASDATLTNESVLTEGAGIDIVVAAGLATVSLDSAFLGEFVEDQVGGFVEPGYDTDVDYSDVGGTLTISGSTALATKTTSYAMGLDDRVILADATSGAMTITLPPVGAALGRIYYVKSINLGPNNVTVVPS